MPPLIRPITIEDAAAFHQALGSVRREKVFLSKLDAPSLERVHEFVSANVRENVPQVVAVNDDGRLIGWCDAIPGHPNTGARHVGVLGMGIVRECRGQGLGRRLLGALLDRARAAGLEKIELAVYASNHAAISLYRSFGFQDEGCKRRGRCVDGVYDDILLMALFLQ